MSSEGELPRREAKPKVFVAARACGTPPVGGQLNRQPEGRKCYNCHRGGHLARACPIAPPSRATQPQPSTSERQTAVNRIESAKATMLNLVATIEGHQFEVFQDWGSQCTMIREDEAAKIQQRAEPCAMVMNGFGGETCVATKMYLLVIKIDDVSAVTEVYVVNNEYLHESLLIDRDYLCQSHIAITIEGGRMRLKHSGCNSTGTRKPIVEGDLDINKQLTINESNLVMQSVNANRDAFATDVTELGDCTLGEMVINLTSDRPVQKRPYPVPFPKRVIIDEMIKEMLRNNVIRPSISPYATPVLLILI